MKYGIKQNPKFFPISKTAKIYNQIAYPLLNYPTNNKGFKRRKKKKTKNNNSNQAFKQLVISKFSFNQLVVSEMLILFPRREGRLGGERQIVKDFLDFFFSFPKTLY